MSETKNLQPESFEAFHLQLNRKDIVPRYCYRRNMVHYKLISYVNNIIGLYLSENYEIIPIFVGRAARHMMDFPENKESTAYYELVTRYLEYVTKFVIRRGFPINELTWLIPEVLLNKILVIEDHTREV